VAARIEAPLQRLAELISACALRKVRTTAARGAEWRPEATHGNIASWAQPALARWGTGAVKWGPLSPQGPGTP